MGGSVLPAGEVSEVSAENGDGGREGGVFGVYCHHLILGNRGGGGGGSPGGRRSDLR